MKRLGISIYPEKSKFEEDKAYIEKAMKLGYSRIFMNMLTIDEANVDAVLKKYRETIAIAKMLNDDVEIFLDVNPLIFKVLKIEVTDFKFFHELGVDGIRLDMGFSGREEAAMTHNEYNIKVEINMSNYSNYLDRIFDFHPKKEMLVGCHNFYPQKYSGLGREHFLLCTKKFNDYQLKTAAFVTSQVGKVGPWELHEGICTLEEHRGLDIEAQVRHLKNFDVIDDIIIGNAYASDLELEQASRAFFTEKHYFRVELETNISEVEKTAILDPKTLVEKAKEQADDRTLEILNFFDIDSHTYRADSSEYMIRSSALRFLLSKADLPKSGANRAITRGDILILNNDYAQYKGEMQVALRDREPDDKVNVVGKICEDDLILLEQINITEDFMLIEK